MSEKELEKKEEEIKATKAQPEAHKEGVDDDDDDNLDEVGVPKMTPLQKRLFELRRKGVTKPIPFYTFHTHTLTCIHFL